MTKQKLRFLVKLVYRREDGKRRISEFYLDNVPAVIRVLEFLKYKKWSLVLMTVSDVFAKNRIQGAAPVLSFYDLDSSLEFAAAEPLTEIYKRILGDFIQSHEVTE